MADIRNKWPWPANVGLLGTFPEEVKALQRRVEKNIDASPLPDAEPARFLRPNESSEALRVGDPHAPAGIHESPTPVLMHVVIARFLKKARRRAVLLFDEAAESELDDEELPDHRHEQMKAMLRRERAMLDLLDRYNVLAQDLYMRLLASSKG